MNIKKKKVINFISYRHPDQYILFKKNICFTHFPIKRNKKGKQTEEQ